VNMGVLQVTHGCVEKTADEQGLLRGVEQSAFKADGAATIGLMHGHSTNGSSRDMQQQKTGLERSVAGPPGSATLIRKCCGVSGRRCCFSPSRGCTKMVVRSKVGLGMEGPPMCHAAHATVE
jgi:hypothetical protein